MNNILSPLHPGLILNMSTRSWIGGLIRLVLARNWDNWRECPNHDAIVVEHDGQLWIGESVAPVAKLTSIEDYEKQIRTGFIYRLRVLEVVGATREQEQAAGKWWLENVRNSPYDWMAFPRLLFKALFGNWINSAAGWEFAFYCTEGVRNAFRWGAGTDPWIKNNPTPLTTWKRYHQGKFRLVEK